MIQRERRRTRAIGRQQTTEAAQGQRLSPLEVADEDLERRLQLEFGRGQLQLERQQTEADHDDAGAEASPAAAGEASEDSVLPPRDAPAPGPVAASVLRRIDELYADCGVQMRVGLTLLRDYLGSHAQCEALDSQHLEDVVRELRPEVKSSTIYATRLRQACRMADMPLLNDTQRSGGEEPLQTEDSSAAPAAGTDHLEDLIVEYFKRRIRNQCQSIDLHRLYRRAELEVLEELDMQVVSRN